MKILIIGNYNSVFVKNFIKNINEYASCIEVNIEIDLLQSGSVSPNYNEYEYFQKIGLLNHFFAGKFILPLGSNSKFWRLLKKLKHNKFVKFAKFFLLSRKVSNSIIDKINNNFIENYDTIILQGFGIAETSLLNQLKITNQYIVGAFWGSDFYKRDKIGDSFLQKTLNKCNAIIISTQQMKNDILSDFHIDTYKIRQALFGVQPLQELFDLRTVSQYISKNKMGFDKGTFVITCGYNGRPDHQHIEIIKALSSLKDELPSNTKVVLPMTYGKEIRYLSQIKMTIRNSGLDCIILENFMSDEEVAHLRKATDIFIQVQIADANSGSFQEHLAAQNVVITGSWLPYKKYKDEGVFFETINNIKELNPKLRNVLQNFPELKAKSEQQNSFDKFKGSLWSECIKDWYNILDEYKNTDGSKN